MFPRLVELAAVHSLCADNLICTLLSCGGPLSRTSAAELPQKEAELRLAEHSCTTVAAVRAESCASIASSIVQLLCSYSAELSHHGVANICKGRSEYIHIFGDEPVLVAAVTRLQAVVVLPPICIRRFCHSLALLCVFCRKFRRRCQVWSTLCLSMPVTNPRCLHRLVCRSMSVRCLICCNVRPLQRQLMDMCASSQCSIGMAATSAAQLSRAAVPETLVFGATTRQKNAPFLL